MLERAEGKSRLVISKGVYVDLMADLISAIWENIYPLGIGIGLGGFVTYVGMSGDVSKREQAVKNKEDYIKRTEQDTAKVQQMSNKVSSELKELVNEKEQIKKSIETQKQYQQSLPDLSKQVGEHEQALTNLAAQLESAEQDKEKAWESAKKADEMEREMKKSLKNLEKKKDEIAEEADEMDKEIEELSLQITRYKNELENVQDAINSAKATRTDLNKEMKEKKASIKEYEKSQAAEIQENSKRAATEAKRVISSAESEAKTILANAMTEVNAIKGDASVSVADAEKFKKAIEDNAEQTSLEAHLDWFSTKIGQTDEIVLSHREKARELHAALTIALEKSQGTKNGAAPDIDQAMNKGDKIDLLYRFYSQKIAEYKADDNLDPDIQQAALLGLQEQMERQIQEISGAFEPE